MNIKVELKNLINILVILIFTAVSLNVNGQSSKTHYIPPLTYGNGATILDQHIYISTPSKDDVIVNITEIGGNTIQKTIKNSNPLEYTIPNSGTSTQSQLVVLNSQAGRVLKDRGYIITADCPIYVSVRYNVNNQAGALVSKGINSTGTHFRTAMYPGGLSNNGDVIFAGDFLNYISFLATEDNTKVKVTLPNAVIGDSRLLINSQNITYNGPFEINLNKNESYIVATTLDNNPPSPESNRFALFGGLIQSIDEDGKEDSSKPIIVNVASANNKVGNNSSQRDQGIDQIVPLNNVGFEYIFVRGNGDNIVENIIVVADKDNTEIYLKDNSTPSYILNAGEFKIISGNEYSTNSPGGTLYIRTQGEDNPLFCYQVVGGNGNSQANLGLFFVPPISESAQDDIDNIALIDEIGNKYPEGGVSIVYVDGANLSVTDDFNGNVDLSSITVNDVKGRDKYKAISIPNLKGNVSVKSDDELYVSYYNRNQWQTSGGFYAGFSSAPKANLDLDISTLGNCVVYDDNGDYIKSNALLEITNSAGFDSWVWEFEESEDIWVQAEGDSENVLTYLPKSDGNYRLKATIECLGSDLFSPVLKVSICPDDYDEDGIVDNLDLDIDNDGILNSIESKGTGTINFTDFENPTITLDNSGTILNSVSISGKVDDSKVSDALSGITGNIGSFESQVEPGANEELIYELNFSEKLNLKISSSTTSVKPSGTTFIIQSFPERSNITLLDPDDNLIIDTNNDDDFEEGITEFTSREIVFKFKDGSGATPDTFEFLAFSIDGILFTHRYSNVSSGESVFVPDVSIYDYKNNTDNTDEDDINDIDSDNDDCIDYIESNTNFDNTLPSFSGLFDINGDGTTYSLLKSLPNLVYPDDIDSRGRIIALLDSSTGTYKEPPVHPDPSNENFLFQNNNSNSLITIVQDVETGVQVCQDGESAQFSISVDPGDSSITPYYQWQFNDGSGWKDVIKDTDKYPNDVFNPILQISNIKTDMDNYKFRVVLWSDANLCPIISGEGELKVEAALPTVKDIDYDNPAFSHVVVCDDGSDFYDGISNFDLTNGGDLTDYFLDNRTDIVVDYFKDSTLALDPDATSDISDYTSFENTPDSSYDPNQPSTQKFEIHVRIKNTITNCIAPPQSFELTVNPLPIIKSEIHTDEQCKTTKVNLTANNEYFSNNYTNEIFSFYNIDETSGDEIEIVNPENYTTNGTPDNPELIRVRFKTKDEGCFQPTITTDNGDVQDFVTLYVYSAGSDIPENFHEDWVNGNISSLTKLESTDDPTGQTQTAVETFDSSVFTNIIDELKKIPEFQESGLVYYFYRSQNHMDNFQGSTDPNIIYSSKDPVSSYTIDPQDEDSANDDEDGFRFNEDKQRWEQDIWLYVENKDLVEKKTECVGEEKVATLFVERKPIAYDVDVLQECDDFESGTEFDGIAGFDTTSIINTLITNPTTGVVDQNPDRFDIIFSYDKDGDDPITDFSSINFESTTQTIYVTMVNKFTETEDGSGNKTYGQSSTEIEFEVYKNPAYNRDNLDESESGEWLYKEFVAFEGNDETDETLFNDGEAFFDLTGIEEKLIDQNQDVADFTFKFSPTPTDFTKYPATDTSEIEVTIYNKTYDVDPSVPYCEKKVIIDFTVLQRPDFEVDQTPPDIFVCLEQPINEYTDLTTMPDYNLIPTKDGKIGVVGEIKPDNDKITFTYSWKFESEDGNIVQEDLQDGTDVVFNTDGSRIGLISSKSAEELGGTYSITLTATYDGRSDVIAKTTKSIDVKVSQAPKMTEQIEGEIITIDDLNYENKTNIEVDTQFIADIIGIGNYEYRLEQRRGEDNYIVVEEYTDTPSWRDMDPGIYRLRIKDTNGCNPEVIIDLYALGYMKYFTPNGDGINDVWNIIGIYIGDDEDLPPLFIFDRFGKLISQINPAGTGNSGFVEQGWNGTFNNKTMPQADYWFKITVPLSNGEDKIFNGHFTLIRGKRRN